MSRTNTLSPVDWIMAGFRALVSGGEQAIKVEPIAKNLNVSKGSFYWHFKDVASLKREMLKHWENIATHDIIAELSSNTTTAPDQESNIAKKQLRQLVEIATSNASEPYGGIQVEPSIRSWARYNSDVAEVLSRVDNTRITFVADLFKQAGLATKQCKPSARLLYGSLIGLEQLACHDSTNPRRELNTLLELIFCNVDN